MSIPEGFAVGAILRCVHDSGLAPDFRKRDGKRGILQDGKLYRVTELRGEDRETLYIEELVPEVRTGIDAVFVTNTAYNYRRFEPL